MNDLRTVSDLVKDILENYPQARNSDNILYLKILEHHSTTKSIDIHVMTVPFFLKELDKHTFPGFETVRRSRQKVQAIYPELAACETVRKLRGKNEKKYYHFAVSEV